MKSRYALLIGVLVSLILLILVLNGVDIQRVEGALARADYRMVLPAFGLLVIGMGTRAIRWRSLLGGRLPLAHAFHILNISYLFNGALPFRLGELARIFLVTRLSDPIPAPTTLSTIVAERLLDMLTVIGLLGLVLTMLPVPAFITTAGLTLGLGAVVGVILLVVIARRRAWTLGLLERLQQRYAWLVRWHPTDIAGRFLDGIQPLASWRGMLTALLWSLVSWGLSVVAGYILMYALFPTPTWTATLLFIVMASLAVSVPYAPGAVGPYEAGVVMALNLTGFDRPEGAAVAFAIVLHATNLGVYVLTGVIGLLFEGVSLGQVAQGARGIKPAAAPTPID